MFLTQLELLYSRIRDAGYAHLLLEPVPLFGLLFGLIFFAIGLWGREDKTRLVALLVIAVSCASVIPYNNYRQQSQARVLEVVPLKKSVRDQMKLREDSQWVYFTISGLALLALIAGGKIGQLSSYGVLVAGVGALIFSAWLHMKEAEIFHPHIRTTVTRTARTQASPSRNTPAPPPAPNPAPAPVPARQSLDTPPQTPN